MTQSHLKWPGETWFSKSTVWHIYAKYCSINITFYRTVPICPLLSDGSTVQCKMKTFKLLWSIYLSQTIKGENTAEIVNWHSGPTILQQNAYKYTALCTDLLTVTSCEAYTHSKQMYILEFHFFHSWHLYMTFEHY